MNIEEFLELFKKHVGKTAWVLSRVVSWDTTRGVHAYLSQLRTEDGDCPITFVGVKEDLRHRDPVSYRVVAAELGLSDDEALAIACASDDRSYCDRELRQVLLAHAGVLVEGR